MPISSGHPARNIESKAKQVVSGIGLSTRLAIAMVSLVVVTTSVLSFITYRSVTEAGIPRALDRLATKAMLSATSLETALNVARQDVLIIQGMTGVMQMGVARAADPFEPVTDTPLREIIAARFLPVLSAKPEYARLRIIGVADGGRELVRVDRSGPGGKIRIVPEAELLQLGERDYFKRAVGRSKSDVYVSSIALQKEDGAGSPVAPMLHVAVPLWTPSGQPFGIGVIDFDLGPKFDRIRAEGDRENQVFVADGAGNYLVHPDRSREFAFEAGAPLRIQNEFPGFDEALAGGAANDSGIWQDRSGARFGVGWAAVHLAGGAGITVLMAATYSNLNPGLAAVSSSALAGGAVAVLLAIVFAIAIARSLSKPLVQITRAVEGFSRGELMAGPSGGGREIGVLCAAFAEMATQLRTKQALLENTIESIGDAVLVANERGQIVVANATAQRLLGIAPGAGRTKGTRKFGFFYPDGVTRMPVSRSALARALRGESVDDLDFIVVPEDLGVAVFMVANARPLKDEFGNLRGAVTVFRNVTETKRAHQSLVDSEQLAQAIIKTALDAFVQLDDAGVILDWSPHAEAMLGWTRSEAVGAKVGNLIVPELQRVAHKQRLAQFLGEVAGGTEGWRYEAPSLHRDGSEIFTEVSLTALRRGDGYIINAFIRNITQKRAAEEQLIQAQKMESVGQLTGGIAHDFNNMLTVITGTIEILAEGVQDQPDLASIAKMISDAADRGSELTANLLAFARKQPLQPAKIDLNELVKEAARLLEPTLGRQIEIETTLSDYLWPAHVDPGQLKSALVNLAINARDAMPDGGKLTFATNNISLDGPVGAARGLDLPGDYVVVEVTDTGTGIPAAIRDKIFEPFFSTKETGKGTGLGLSMVFGFAKQSGGNIEVRSEDGCGTNFKIYLPRAEEAVLRLPPTDNLQSPGGAETILCVEDDPSVRVYAIAQLESLGYKVLVASNAAEALAIADTGAEFDLLFTDIVMPGKLNGRQLAEAMALQRSSLRVLFTSGYTYHALTRHGRVAPDIRLLVKPYRRAELARMLRLCLDPSVDAASDPIPLPYSVQEDLDRFLGMAPP
jgi:PAS domain S-box-containing protein